MEPHRAPPTAKVSSPRTSSDPTTVEADSRLRVHRRWTRRRETTGAGALAWSAPPGAQSGPGPAGRESTTPAPPRSSGCPAIPLPPRWSSSFSPCRCSRPSGGARRPRTGSWPRLIATGPLPLTSRTGYPSRSALAAAPASRSRRRLYQPACPGRRLVAHPRRPGQLPGRYPDRDSAHHRHQLKPPRRPRHILARPL
jgi:hypothetical protein